MESSTGLGRQAERRAWAQSRLSGASRMLAAAKGESILAARELYSHEAAFLYLMIPRDAPRLHREDTEAVPERLGSVAHASGRRTESGSSS